MFYNLLIGCSFLCLVECALTRRPTVRNCPNDMQSNGFEVCGYVVSLQQTVNYTHYPTDHAISTLDVIQWPAPRFIATEAWKLRNYFSPELNSTINELLITEITNLHTTLYNISYDIYCNDAFVRPVDFIRNYSEVKKNLRIVSGNKRMFTGWSDPEKQNMCAGKVMSYQGRKYRFHKSRAGRTGSSMPKCPDGTPKATARCVSGKYPDGSPRIYYDYKSIKVRYCDTLIESRSNEDSEVETWSDHIEELLEEGTHDEGGQESQESHSDYIERGTESILGFTNAIEESNSTVSLQDLNNTLSLTDILIEKQVQYSQMLKSAGRQMKSFPQGAQVALALETLATRTEENVTVDRDSLFVQIAQVSPQSSHQIVDYSRSMDVIATNGQVNFTLPAEAIQQALMESSQKSVSLSYILFKDNTLFESTVTKDFNINQVLAVSVGGARLQNLEYPFTYNITMTNNNETKKSQLKMTRCAYLDEKTLEWLSDGCTTQISDDNQPECNCNHLTNFAVLVRYYNFPLPYAMELFGIIGCSLSILGLILMLICTLGSSTLRKLPTYRIHCHLGFCLLLAYIIFLGGVERIEYTTSCIVIAALIQFLLISSWGWMMVECITMYRKLVVVLGELGSYYVMKASFMVYSTSATIVVVNLVITVAWLDNISIDWVGIGDHQLSTYVSERLCWLHGYSLIFGFLCPCGLALFINIIGCILVTKALTCDRIKVRSSRGHKSSRKEAKTYLIRGSIVAVLFGLTWSFAVPLTATDNPAANEIFGWLFSAFNALQGLFIFILFCVLNEKVRGIWAKKLGIRKCPKKKDTNTSEGSGSPKTQPATNSDTRK